MEDLESPFYSDYTEEAALFEKAKSVLPDYTVDIVIVDIRSLIWHHPKDFVKDWVANDYMDLLEQSDFIFNWALTYILHGHRPDTNWFESCLNDLNSKSKSTIHCTVLDKGLTLKYMMLLKTEVDKLIGKYTNGLANYFVNPEALVENKSFYVVSDVSLPDYMVLHICKSNNEIEK